ncbi:MAG: hypothetical protein FJ096_12050 [Deltaproteobacteria bacterium]|nr:hypothetical protein [Deltaproteobacteria bacterium]
MWLLVASVVALLVGPALARVAGDRRGPLAALDGFIVVALLGLVLLEVLPEAFEHAGSLAVVAAVVGLAMPRLLEGRLHVAEGHLHGAVTWGAVLGYSVHAVLDGAALDGATSSLALGLGVALHRVPVGVTIGWLIRPRHGVRGAVLAVTLIGAATALGYLGAGRLVGALPLGTLGLFQALVGGSLLHVVAGHAHHGAEPSDVAPRASAVGALAAAAFLVGVSRLAGEGHEHGLIELVSFAVAAAPFVLAGAGLVVVASAVVGRRFASLLGLARLEVLAFAAALGLMGIKLALGRLGLFVLGLTVFQRMRRRSTGGSDAAAGPTVPIEFGASQLVLGATCAAIVHSGLGDSVPGGAVSIAVAAALGLFVPMSGLAATLVSAALLPRVPAASLVFGVVAPLVWVARAEQADEDGLPRTRWGALAVALGVVVGAVLGFDRLNPGALRSLASSPGGAAWIPRAVATGALALLGLVLVRRLVASGARGLVRRAVEPDGRDSATERTHVHADGYDHPHHHA